MKRRVDRAHRWQRLAGYSLLALGLAGLVTTLVLLRLTAVTDYLYHSTIKDPQRTAPEGRVLVAPADGIVLYVRRIADGVIPEVVKRGVPVPMVDHLKTAGPPAFQDGYLIGIYMNTHGVHINRVPDHGVVKEITIWNGPHMNMTSTEAELVLTQMIPGKVALRKLLGRPPYDIAETSDYILKSSRETLRMEDDRGGSIYVVRIGDYWVGKILTWVQEGERVERGQKLGLISWGSQTDIFFEASAETRIRVAVGDYVSGGETILASY